MGKATTPSFVVSFRLNTQPWQEDVLGKRFELLTSIYNSLQWKLMRIYRYMAKSKEFKAIKNVKELQAYIRKYSIMGTTPIFTQYGINEYIKKFNTERYHSQGINSVMLRSVSNNVYAAWEKFFKSPQNLHQDPIGRVHFKARVKGEHVDSYIINPTKNNKNDTITFTGINISLLLTKHSIGINYKHFKNTQGKAVKKMMFIPFIFDEDNIYEKEALSKPIKQIGVKREFIRGKYVYYVFFVFEGHPYLKGRGIGQGRVGIDIGPSTVAVVGEHDAKLFELAKGTNFDEKKVACLNRQMDRSRRANNPQNYQEDGQIRRFKKGEKRTWNLSNRYIKTRSKYSNYFRKLAVKRKIAHNILANQILTMGNEFVVEKNSFCAMKKRAKETKKKTNGRFASKKRMGKSIGNHAPGMQVSIIGSKAKHYTNGNFIKVATSIAATQFDFTSGEFIPKGLHKRWAKLSDGTSHQRDLWAAFNLQHIKNPKVKNKTIDSYDVTQMGNDYENYKKLENAEIKRLHDFTQQGANFPSSFGIKKIPSSFELSE